MSLYRTTTLGLATLAILGGTFALTHTQAQADGLPFDEKLLDSMTELPGEIGPLPAVPVPKHNPQTPAKIALGKKLYFDTRLSGNNKVSCATCHDPALGFSDGRARAAAFEGGELGRHSPVVTNAAYYKSQFWDGRAADLEAQAKGPMLAEGEMHGSIANIEKLLKSDAGYRRMFKQAFGEVGSFDTAAKAIAAYERTVVSTNSPFDRYMQGDKKALTLAQKRGLWVFVGKASCTECHNGPNFSDSEFHNLGVPAVGPLEHDEGRFAVTKNPKDMGAFKTPTLRDVAKSAPYMHNGAHSSLEEVVAFYNDGGGHDKHLSPKVKKLGLSDQEKADLVAFLEALSGEIPASARTAPTR